MWKSAFTIIFPSDITDSSFSMLQSYFKMSFMFGSSVFYMAVSFRVALFVVDVKKVVMDFVDVSIFVVSEFSMDSM